MEYMELISKTKYGSMGIMHSIFRDGDIILSFENWKFSIYNFSYLIDNEIKAIIYVPTFDLTQYDGLELKDYLYYEALSYIANENGIIMPIVVQKTKYIFRWLIVFAVYWILMFLFWYYWFSMSEEQFLKYKMELCQE